MMWKRTFTVFGLAFVALSLAATIGCSSSDEDDGDLCNEGTLRCSDNRIEVCTAVSDAGVSTTQWTLVTDCETTEQECTTNVARCGGIGPCCAD